ncbi:hypothetical protein EC9_54680 [Rosistilla ulvae]|uniref:VWFA domain-containing protein n=1 Tax=Rosistilla ulvae TaxID=1930277 RepID=A0A517M8Q0_9BACT|nr:VWA domain-containing protein [Rosistilla ulvae]QDS91244.1 hypothetical protein EC9_54680 [Rosistilla ulvae]
MMGLLHNLHFVRPLALGMIPIAIAVWWYWQRQLDPLRGWRQQIDPDLLEALVDDRDAKRDPLRYAMLAAWIVAAIAIAGPTWKLEPNPFAEDAPPLVIVLKAGESMLKTNPSPSRMERAQLKIVDLAKARKGDPLGLLAYSGSAHLVLPPTQDTAVIGEMAAEISPDVMPVPGDRLDLAIAAAGGLLREQGSGGSLLVVADAAEIDPSEVAKAHRSIGSPPIEFLALTDPDSAETKTLRDVAAAIGGSVESLSIEDDDIQKILSFAQRRAAAGVSGESNRWQEAGYWLTPLLALFVAVSFRRQKSSQPKE